MTVQVGLIGTGGIANTHIKHLKTMDSARVVACCDVVPGRAQEFAQKHDIPRAYESSTELLADAEVEAVFVGTPDRHHAAPSIEALEAGKHVICEKPLATSYAEALTMLEAARKAGTVNMVGFSKRSKAAIHTAKQWIEEGKLGRIYHVEGHYMQHWLLTREWGDYREKPNWLARLSTQLGSTGVLGDLGVHIVDFVTMPVGPVAKVFCHLVNYKEKAPGNRVGDVLLDADDTAMITMEFENGATGCITTSRAGTGLNEFFPLIIHGDRGAVRIASDSPDVLEYMLLTDEGKHAPWQKLECGPEPTVYHHFVEACESGQSRDPDFARGVEVQRILEACRRSSNENRMVDIAEIQ